VPPFHFKTQHRQLTGPLLVSACRWKEAHDAGKAPKVVLSGCHARALDYVDLEVLKQYAVLEDEQADTSAL
jgi:uncharacterized protein (DUF2237 family)